MFNLGEIIVSPRIADATRDRNFMLEVQGIYARYRTRDWGDVKERYKNDLALINKNDKILAEYTTSKGVVYIITERDRSATNILFAEEHKGE